MKNKVAIIGGGAAGFFSAINIAALHPDTEVHIFEKSKHFLSKVKVSGGGRCNVTHACFEPSELVQHYPRGRKELLGPFTIFNPQHTIEWFRKNGVEILRETDGRMFPTSNSSQTIIDCFMDAARKYHIELYTETGLQSLEKNTDGKWILKFADHSQFIADALVIAGGSSNSLWNIIATLGHTIIPPVPSLFSFNIKDARIDGLMGVSIAEVACSIGGLKVETKGPMIITHWGLSGPAILKLSSIAARQLHAMNYDFMLNVNFIPSMNTQQCMEYLFQQKKEHPKKSIHQAVITALSSRLLKSICNFCTIDDKMNWSDIPKEKMQLLAETLINSRFQVNGKSTFKDEFVTCGGVQLSEINMKKMESKIHPHLYFAGEVMDIDAVTGGFNFQAAWTTAMIAATSISFD